MTSRDFINLSLGNLWRMKLRAFLTISGVVIAIAAFVSMVSFGAGNQERIQEQFTQFGLFGTMIVYPPNESDSSDAKLDFDALHRLQAFDGVNLVYPYSNFSVTVETADTLITGSAQAVPTAAFATPLLSQFHAGGPMTDSGRGQIVIEKDALEDLGLPPGDSAIGQSLILSVSVASLDSALAYAFRDLMRSAGQRTRRNVLDSLRNEQYLQRILREELSGTMSQFVQGFLNVRTKVSDTLTIVGVLQEREIGRRARSAPFLISMPTALRFDTAGFSGDMTSLLSAMQSGSFFGGASQTGTYDRVTVDFEPTINYQMLKDSVEALGFRTFSYAEEFDEIRQFFLYFNFALGMIGLIALSTASLGIVNTMVMSILERTREIGVMKSLGADETTIRRLFLAESACIGSIGAIGGIFFGWVISRVASLIAKTFMEREGIDPLELFALPWWLILIAFSLGLIVSLIAGYYPARRAARVDPVEALRND